MLGQTLLPKLMYDDTLEQLVLSGALFNGNGNREPGSPVRSRSPSQSRPSSPTAANSGDAVQFGSPDEEYESSYVGDSAHHRPPEEQPHESIGMGPGRTGVKGVIRDRDEAMERDREKAREQRTELNAQMKKMDLSARTYFEEQDATDADPSGSSKQNREGDAWEGIDGWRRKRLEELRSGGTSGAGGPGMYGHLREVGLSGYLEAIEKVPRNVWVVIHLYDSVSDCSRERMPCNCYSGCRLTVIVPMLGAGLPACATRAASSISEISESPSGSHRIRYRRRHRIVIGRPRSTARQTSHKE